MTESKIARALLESGVTMTKSKLQDLVRTAPEREFAVVHDPASKCLIVRIKLKQ